MAFRIFGLSCHCVRESDCCCRRTLIVARWPLTGRILSRVREVSTSVYVRAVVRPLGSGGPILPDYRVCWAFTHSPIIDAALLFITGILNRHITHGYSNKQPERVARQAFLGSPKRPSCISLIARLGTPLVPFISIRMGGGGW